ncbi:MAG TPA: class I SAM-dependent RNA methyltransferase [Bryobacteraceae bacterium]|jgi:23S rRNA (uracil1939-C5)-methyltransferase|nr:class I SAM-dependent RNA methyltransferase [Bryobacteraceae bacterium]
MAQATTVTVDIEKLVYGGEGLGRSDGQVVLVPFVLPGERVEVQASRVKNGLLRGTEGKILEASPERIAPFCEYFANCGGCHYQHAPYDFQLRQKQAILRETLQRLGGIAFEDEIAVVAGDPWNYRNRIQLHFGKRRVGFRRADSHELCAITHCPISSPRLNDLIAKLDWAVKQREWPGFLQSLEIFTNEKDVQLTVTDSTRPVAARFFTWCGTFLEGLAPGPIEYTAAGHTFRIGGGSFFQVNRFLIDALVDTVLGDARGEYAVDLYAGAGLFTLPLAARFGRVDAVERGGSAFRDLEHNAGERNIQCIKAATEDYLGRLQTKPNVIFADPPRAGLGPETTRAILSIAPERLTVVSCDPATLARDLKLLLPAYRIAKLALVDLFPQTYHFETVAHLAIK